MTTLECDFALGDQVIIDNDESVPGVIIGIYYSGIFRYEVSWMTNGELKSTYIDSWRLQIAEEQQQESYDKLKPSHGDR
jgi:hypothetical protein